MPEELSFEDFVEEMYRRADQDPQLRDVLRRYTMWGFKGAVGMALLTAHNAYIDTGDLDKAYQVFREYLLGVEADTRSYYATNAPG